MCFGHPRQSPWGYVIAGLRPGNEIRVSPGFGKPASNRPRIAIVVEVDGQSALATTERGAIQLMCKDGEGVTKTGDHFAPNTFRISAAAKRMMEKAARKREEMTGIFLN